jgi:hypothetical protein
MNGNPMGHFCGYMENVIPLSSFTCSSPLTEILVSQPVVEKVYLRMLFPKLSSPQELIFSASSALIEDVKAMCDRGLGTFAYFYFDFKDFSKRDIRSLLSSILIQLSDQSDEYWSILSHLYTTHRDGSNQPSEAALITCLHDMLYVDGQQPTFIIMDAVDECPNTPGLPSAREKVLNLVEDLVTNSYPDLRICITSRLEQDIRMVLEPLASCHISLHDQEGQMGDIANYVRFVVHLDRTMRRWRTEDKELVIDTLIERADGM